jgi:acyl dehydratase
MKEEAVFSQMITEKEVSAFMELTGDDNKIHWDKAYTRQFERPVVHGMLVASYISKMIGMILPGEGAVLSSANFSWLHPVYIFDKITIKAKITYSKDKFVEMETDVYNQNDELVVTGQVWVKI